MVNFLNKWLKLDKRKWNDRLKNRLNNISWKLINYIWDNCFRVLYLYFPLVSAKWEKAFLYSKFLNCVYLFGNIINDNRINIWNSILKEGVNVAWKFFLLFKCCFSIRILLTLFSRYHCKWATFKMFPGVANQHRCSIVLINDKNHTCDRGKIIRNSRWPNNTSLKIEKGLL